MLLPSETPFDRSPGTPKTPPRVRTAAPECDFCGRPVRRESAIQRLHRDEEGVEIVLVCPECESGAD
jgi:hypothetical protein